MTLYSCGKSEKQKCTDLFLSSETTRRISFKIFNTLWLGCGDSPRIDVIQLRAMSRPNGAETRNALYTYSINTTYNGTQPLPPPPSIDPNEFIHQCGGYEEVKTTKAGTRLIKIVVFPAFQFFIYFCDKNLPSFVNTLTSCIIFRFS
jgi:hypothetical protein